jgi:hypothetical protein
MKMIVRTLLASDAFPVGFNTGFENMPVMKSFVWVAEEDNETAGVLLAAPMHGLIYILRLCIRAGAPSGTAPILLRGFMRDALKRGFRGYILHVDPTQGIGGRLIPIVKKAKGIQMMIPQVMLVGAVETAAKL